jgi:acid ceramidase
MPPSVPTIPVPLDAPPRERWRALAEHAPAVRELVAVYVRDLGGDDVAQLAATAARAILAPDELDEIAGVARATGISDEHAIAANVYYDALKHIWGCTAFAVDTPEGPLHARNLDWHTVDRALARHTAILDFHRGGTTRFRAVGWPGFIGVLSGVAPGRFAITLNAVLSFDRPPPEGRLVGLVLRDVLERAASYGEAVEELCSQPLASDALLLVSGVHHGERTVIERTPLRAARRLPQDDGVMVVTNDYRALAVDGATGRSDLAATACARFDRAAAHLATHRGLDADACLALLSDPGVRMAITVQQMVFQAATGLCRVRPV